MKISIIIPVYNVEAYLRHALDSVVNQTLKDIEIICVDDCSSDNSWDILCEYAQKDERFKIYKQEFNQGPGTARNRALDVASGEYIMFLDPDDWLDLSACEILYNQAVKYNNDMVMLNYNKYFENSKTYDKVAGHTKPFVDEPDKNHIVINKCNNNFFISTFLCFQIYKKSLLDEFNIKFTTHRFCEDDLFVVKAFLHSKNMSIIPESLYFYRIRQNSLMHSPDLYFNVIETKMLCYNYVLDYCEKNNLTRPIYYFVDYLVNSFTYYLDCLIMQNYLFANNYYNSIKKIFIKIQNKYPEHVLRKLKKYKKLKNITNTNWFSYFLQISIQKLFYLGNTPDKRHKIIIIAGIKFKIKKNRNLNQNYRLILKKIKNKYNNHEKIKVLFLSSEISKWKYDSLYKLFKSNENFEPIVGIFPLSRSMNGLDNTQPTLKQQYEFYKKKNINVIYLYDNQYFKPVSEIEPDIVFYQQQWDIPFEYQPVQMSEYALTCACSYSYEILNDKNNYNKNYHSKLFRYYIEDDLNKKRYAKYPQFKNNCIVTGYLKLDSYLDNNKPNANNYWKSPEKFKIIYAPHHSLDEEDRDCLFLATFKQNGKFILDYAKSHPETTWIFKPHPRLKFVLEKEKIMTVKEITEYYNTWEQIGNICNDGDYIDIFKTSDLMLTDCCSFLAEYLPSGKPLIRMVNKNGINLNELGEKVCSEYYISHNNNELKNYLDELVINHNDYKKEKRYQIINSILDSNKSSAEKIFEDIERRIND